METLPDELKLSIFKFLVPDKYCYIKDLFNAMLVCKEWYNLINDEEIKEHYISSVYAYSYYTRKLNITLKYEIIYKLHCYRNIYLKYDPFLIHFLSYNFIKNLPICYFTDSRCIDNMCSTKCYRKHHNLNKFITANIMRGIDDKNRDYILVAYKNLSTMEKIYEFIYHKTLSRNYKIITFSGVYNKTYIGLNTYLYRYLYQYDTYRELNIDAYNYLYRLINKKPCGILKYNPDTDLFYESYNELIRIL